MDAILNHNMNALVLRMFRAMALSRKIDVTPLRALAQNLLQALLLSWFALVFACVAVGVGVITFTRCRWFTRKLV